MPSPPFTWWPWKLLALAVPAIAVFAGYTFTQDPHADPEYLAPMVLGVLSAGNAYVIAIASGNLGRTVLALPVGVLAGFLPFVLLSFTPAYMLYLLLVLSWGLLSITGWVMKGMSASGPWLTCCYLGTLGCSCAFIVALGASLAVTPVLKTPAASIPVCYPFVCGCVAACMIPHTRYRGPLEGFLDSLTCSLRALAVAAIALLPLTIVVNNLPVRSSPLLVGALLGGPLLLVCNYSFLKNFFSAIVRDTPPPKAEPPPEVAPEPPSDEQQL